MLEAYEIKFAILISLKEKKAATLFYPLKIFVLNSIVESLIMVGKICYAPYFIFW